MEADLDYDIRGACSAGFFC